MRLRAISVLILAVANMGRRPWSGSFWPNDFSALILRFPGATVRSAPASSGARLWPYRSSSSARWRFMCSRLLGVTAKSAPVRSGHFHGGAGSGSA